MKVIMKKFRYPKESALMIKYINKTIENKTKEQKGRFRLVLLHIFY